MWLKISEKKFQNFLGVSEETLISNEKRRAEAKRAMKIAC